MNRYKEARHIAMHARASAASPVERAEPEHFLFYLDQVSQYSRGDSDAAETAAVRESASTAANSSSGANSLAQAAEAASARTAGGDAGAAALREATGTVTKLSCMNGLKFELDTGAGTLTLHAKPGAQYQIKLATRPSGPFNPCTAIQGQRVKVEYQPVGGNGKTGEVESLTVLTVAGGDGSGGGARRLGVGSSRADPLTVSAEGNVTQVLCNGHELTLNLDAGDKTLILHARDATRVQFEQDVAFDAENFEPCTQLRGRQSKITYVVVEGKSYDGEIQGVEVEK